MKGEPHSSFGAKDIHNDNSFKNEMPHTGPDLSVCPFQIHWDPEALRNPLDKTFEAPPALCLALSPSAEPEQGSC